MIGPFDPGLAFLLLVAIFFFPVWGALLLGLLAAVFLGIPFVGYLAVIFSTAFWKGLFTGKRK